MSKLVAKQILSCEIIKNLNNKFYEYYIIMNITTIRHKLNGK